MNMQTMTNQFNPDFVSPPGDTLKELLEIMSVSQDELVYQLGLPKKTVNEIIRGEIAITVEIALQLENWFPKVSAIFWIMREFDYRLGLARMANPVHTIQSYTQAEGETYLFVDEAV